MHHPMWEKEGIGAILGREFGGRELSGGQWQRTAIARGIYRDCVRENALFPRIIRCES